MADPKEDEVLKRMLKTPPKKHEPKALDGMQSDGEKREKNKGQAEG